MLPEDAQEWYERGQFEGEPPPGSFFAACERLHDAAADLWRTFLASLGIRATRDE